MTDLLAREMLFADGAAIATHTGEDHQRLIDRLYKAYTNRLFTVRLKRQTSLAVSPTAYPALSM
ncbi:hypothetical protein DPMN_094629 [Dreissena polymorpha]|uniref:Uncharacterized protein n=1 Tax=Dreissena polymorpha TaxID=45954 RepID=A0A9D4L800_DREPO|nr:hypothetical protein DPMN_094629 [Dreissena polymorpha]